MKLMDFFIRISSYNECKFCRMNMKRWISSQKVETMAGVYSRAPTPTFLQLHQVEIHH